LLIRLQLYETEVLTYKKDIKDISDEYCLFISKFNELDSLKQKAENLLSISNIELDTLNKHNKNLIAEIFELNQKNSQFSNNIVRLEADLVKYDKVVQEMKKVEQIRAESELNSLKEKYTLEKQLMSLAMNEYTNEIKSLKKDVKAMGVEIETYFVKLNSSQIQIRELESENKSLGSMLRLAIEQKLEFTEIIKKK